MARSIRIEYAGANYHVMARGNRREAIFLDDDDRRFFLGALSEACGMTGWRVFAWVLMSNHYHLCIQTPEPNLVAGMKWLQNTVTRRFNVRHRAWGRVFGDRYKAISVEGGGYYGRTLVDYIHLNPVRAGIIKPGEGQSVLDFPWSSVAGGYALPPEKRAKWLAAEAGLAEQGLPDTAEGRREYVERLDRRAVVEGAARSGIPEASPEVDARRSNLRRGWYWGSQEFSERLLRTLEAMKGKGKSRGYEKATEKRAHGEKQAERWLAEGLEAAGLNAVELKRLPGSDGRKAALAELLWSRTTVSQEWLAERLYLKSASNACQVIRRYKKQREKVSLPRALADFIKRATTEE
jgi:putative transposase